MYAAPRMHTRPKRTREAQAPIRRRAANRVSNGSRALGPRRRLSEDRGLLGPTNDLISEDDDMLVRGIW